MQSQKTLNGKKKCINTRIFTFNTKYIFIVNKINKNNSIEFPYLSACQEGVACNRRAPKIYITKARLKLELEINKTIK
jgi:hypothetical protein